MKLSMIIPTHNSAQSLQKKLAGVQSQRGTNLEIIVVDYASTDSTIQQAQRLADRVVSLSPTVPYTPAYGLARGYALATGELMWCVAGNYVITKDHLAAIDQVFRHDPKVVAASFLLAPQSLRQLWHNWKLFFYNRIIRTGLGNDATIVLRWRALSPQRLEEYSRTNNSKAFYQMVAQLGQIRIIWGQTLSV